MQSWVSIKSLSSKTHEARGRLFRNNPAEVWKEVSEEGGSKSQPGVSDLWGVCGHECPLGGYKNKMNTMLWLQLLIFGEALNVKQKSNKKQTDCS